MTVRSLFLISRGVSFLLLGLLCGDRFQQVSELGLQAEIFHLECSHFLKTVLQRQNSLDSRSDCLDPEWHSAILLSSVITLLDSLDLQYGQIRAMVTALIIHKMLLPLFL